MLRRAALVLLWSLPLAARGGPVPTFVNKGTFTSGTGALTVPMPASIQQGDLIFIFAESANEAIGTPSGYAEMTGSPQGTGTAAAAGGVRGAVFWKCAGASEGSASVADSGNHTTAISVAFRGVDCSSESAWRNTSNTKLDSTATSSMSWPTVTTTVANALIVQFAALDQDIAGTAQVGTVTNTSLTSITDIHDQTVSSGVGGGIFVTRGTRSSAGSVTASTATGAASTTHAYFTIALAPQTTFTETVSEGVTLADSQTNTATFAEAVSEGVTLADTVDVTGGSAAAVPPALVQHKELAGSGSSTGTYAVTFDADTTAGNMILVAVSSSDGASTSWSVTDNKSNTYRSSTAAQFLNGSFPLIKLFWVENAAGGATHTVTVDGANWETIQVSISEWSGIYDAGDPFDVGSTGGGYDQLSTSATATTAQADELIVGVIYRLDGATNYTEDTSAGFTKVSEVDSPTQAVEYKAVTATGTYSTTWASASTSGNNYLVTATFKAAGGGGGPQTYAETVSEAVTLTDAAASTFTGPNAASEAVTLGDSLASTSTLPNAQSEAVTLDDSMPETYTPGGGGPQVYDETVSEGITPGDSLAVAATFPNAPSEAVTLGDAAPSVGAFPNAMSEAVSPGDAAPSAQVVVASLTEAITVGDSMPEDVTVGGHTFNETITEPLNLGTGEGTRRRHVGACLFPGRCD